MKDILYPLRRMHGCINDAWLKYKKRKQYEHVFRKNPRTVFLVLTPEHGNLGDHAIAQAETEILKKNNISYIEITGRQLREMKTRNELKLMDGFPILINGGGNLGTLWMDVETLEREIIESNPKSTIVILPNTIYYEHSVQGKVEFEKSKKIYNNHNYLFLFAREKASFLLMKEAFRNVRLVPDMVLSLNKCRKGTKRCGCTLCLRNDREKTLTDEQESIIIQQVTSLFNNDITIIDMVVPHPVTIEQRKIELEKKYDEFRSTELVITDRLHGMIFAAITGTPCIVVDSKSPKVRGCYEWIKDLNYIRFADDVSKIVNEYKQIQKGEHVYNNDHLNHYYQELEDFILHRIIKEN